MKFLDKTGLDRHIEHERLEFAQKTVNRYIDVNTNGYEYVDLGLPSGLLWAKYNVGATTVSGDGGSFAWGETTTKSEYTWSNYAFGDADNLTKYNSSDNLIKLELEDDAASVIWGGDWRIPSKDDFIELRYNTSMEKVTVDGVSCIKYTGNNGNFIYFRSNNYYWINSIDNANPQNIAYSRAFAYSADTLAFMRTQRYKGYYVRPVLNQIECGPIYALGISTNIDDDKNTNGKLATSKAVYDAVSEVPRGNVVGTGITNIISISETDYEALSVKDPETLYIVTPTLRNNNYLKLVSTVPSAVSGDVAEVGSAYDISDLTNNPPIIYFNGEEKEIESLYISGTELLVTWSGMFNQCYITTAQNPATWFISGGGGSEK